jgi:hypothetical protein
MIVARYEVQAGTAGLQWVRRPALLFGTRITHTLGNPQNKRFALMKGREMRVPDEARTYYCAL